MFEHVWMTYRMTRQQELFKVIVGSDNSIPVMISQCVPVDRFHYMVGAPAAALHDIGIRDSCGVKGRYHVVPVIVKSEVLYAVGF